MAIPVARGGAGSAQSPPLSFSPTPTSAHGTWIMWVLSGHRSFECCPTHNHAQTCECVPGLLFRSLRRGQKKENGRQTEKESAQEIHEHTRACTGTPEYTLGRSARRSSAVVVVGRGSTLINNNGKRTNRPEEQQEEAKKRRGAFRSARIFEGGAQSTSGRTNEGRAIAGLPDRVRPDPASAFAFPVPHALQRGSPV